MSETSQKLVLIADRGLLTRQAVHYYVQTGIGFIGCLRDNKDLDRAIAAVSDDELLKSPLAYLPVRAKPRGRTKPASDQYYGVRHMVTLSSFSDTDTKRKYPDLTLDAMVVLADGKRRLDRQLREDQLRKVHLRLTEISSHLNNGRYKDRTYATTQIEKALNKYPSLRGMYSYALLDQPLSPDEPLCTDVSDSEAPTTGPSYPDGGEAMGSSHVSDSEAPTTGERPPTELALTWERNEEAIADAAVSDGKYIIVTSESHLTNDELLTAYKERDRVEKRVECLKGPITVRPIYLHKDERILGLLFANMMALLAFGITEMQSRRNGMRVTGAEVQRTFADYSATVLVFSDASRAVTLPQGDRKQRQLHCTLGITPTSARQIPAELVFNLDSHNNAAAPEQDRSNTDDS